jgi:ribosomal protein L11 methyltransferase
MRYYSFCVTGPLENEGIVGILSQWPFESFMEEEEGLCAYLPETQYGQELENEVRSCLTSYTLGLKVRLIPAQNWNEEWEKNFQPVYIDDFCCIRADFHKDIRPTRHTISIHPRMAFGTGHHETTWMMIRAMRDLHMDGARVFDYGTGTGILAILASKLGAEWVDAIDNDPHAVENAQYNARINGVQNLSALESDLAGFSGSPDYGIVLANINFPVLMQDAERLTKYTAKGGTLLLSGILEEQADRVLDRYTDLGLLLIQRFAKGYWVCLEFSRSI